MRARIVIIGAGISGLTAAITIGEGVDKLIAAGETIARPEMTLLDAADWIGGARALMSCLRVCRWMPERTGSMARQEPVLQMGLRSALRSGADRHRYRHAALQCLGGRRSGAEQREWAMNRLYEMYAIWKAQHRMKTCRSGNWPTCRNPA